jgi:hypothetical protein
VASSNSPRSRAGRAHELTGDALVCSAHLTINCLAHVVLISHLLPVLEKTSTQHPEADVRLVLQASEMHRTTFGGPSENFGGDKFRSTEEFKASRAACSAAIWASDLLALDLERAL